MSGEKIEKQPAPPGYRYIVRLKGKHTIMGVWKHRPDACEQAWDWNQTHYADKSTQVYIEDQGE
jgi:hypothetical protein